MELRIAKAKLCLRPVLPRSIAAVQRVQRGLRAFPRAQRRIESPKCFPAAELEVVPLRLERTESREKNGAPLPRRNQTARR
jgi:hypothetical protein